MDRLAVVLERPFEDSFKMIALESIIYIHRPPLAKQYAYLSYKYVPSKDLYPIKFAVVMSILFHMSIDYYNDRLKADD